MDYLTVIPERGDSKNLKTELAKTKKARHDVELFSRGRGIRTPGTSRYNGFQDRRIRPLCHSSV